MAMATHRSDDQKQVVLLFDPEDALSIKFSIGGYLSYESIDLSAG
jgi:hypothetical protein